MGSQYESVRAGVEKLVHDHELRHTMGDTGREFVKEHFNWGLFEEQYRQLLVAELEKMGTDHG